MGHLCPGGIRPRTWPSVTDIQFHYHARYPTNDWHLAYMFSLVYFSVEVWLVGMFPHSFSTRQIPASGSKHPSRWFPLSRENIIRTGVTRISTRSKWGGIWTDVWVCLHYWLVIWVAGYSRLLPHDWINNSGDKLSHTGNVISEPSAVKQVVVAVILISTSTCRVWNMYLCIDSVKFALELAGATILAQALLFCGGATNSWQYADTSIG